MNNYQFGILLVSITTLCWGFLSIAIKYSLQFNHPYTIVWFRFFLAFLILFIYFLIKSPSSLKILLRPPPLSLLSGIGLSVNYLGFLLCVKYTSPSNANILIQHAPILAAILGIFIFKETFNKTQQFGFVLSISGLIVFFFDQIKNSLNNFDLYLIGNLWILCAGIFWVLWVLTQKKLVLKHDSNKLNLITFAIGTLIFLPLVKFEEFHQINLPMSFSLIYLGLNTLIAYGCLAKSLQFIPSNLASMIITINPVITLIAMTYLNRFEFQWLEKENISLKGYIGALFLISGLVLISKKKEKMRNS